MCEGAILDSMMVKSSKKLDDIAIGVLQQQRITHSKAEKLKGKIACKKYLNGVKGNEEKSSCSRSSICECRQRDHKITLIVCKLLSQQKQNSVAAANEGC